MIYDYLTGQLISDTVPDSISYYANQPGSVASFDNSPFDTLVNNFYYDGANYYYYQTDSAAIDFSANPVFNGTLFPSTQELVNNLPAQNQNVPNTFTFGSNFAGEQGIALTNGLLAGGDPSFAAGNQSIVNNGGLQNLPQGGFGSNF